MTKESTSPGMVLITSVGEPHFSRFGFAYQQRSKLGPDPGSWCSRNSVSAAFPGWR